MCRNRDFGPQRMVEMVRMRERLPNKASLDQNDPNTRLVWYSYYVYSEGLNLRFDLLKELIKFLSSSLIEEPSAI